MPPAWVHRVRVNWGDGREQFRWKGIKTVSAGSVGSAKRRVASLLALAVVGAAMLVGPGAASAFNFQHPKYWWAGHPAKITYFNEAKRQAKEVRKAVSIWNSSGIKARFVKVNSKRRAKLVIIPHKGSCGSGLANVNFSTPTGGLATKATIDFTTEPSKQCSQVVTTVLAHELGHVLGLGHENRRCAVMNSLNTALSTDWIGPIHCRTPPGTWYCRVLSPDDLRGARKLYGGKTKLRKRESCPLPDTPEPTPEPTPVTNPGAVKSLSVSPVSGRDPTALVRWELPSKNAPKRLALYLGGPNGSCPSRTGSGASRSVTVSATSRRHEFTVGEAGTFCVTAVSLKSNGSAGKFVTAKTSLSGYSPEPYFRVNYDFDDGLLLYFQDESSDRDGQVVSWSWNFGDGTTSTERNPVHRYAGSGEYTVTLTVTDEDGNSASTTDTVFPESFSF